MTLILSIFPGIDALGLAFAEVFPEACIVRGPDPIFGSLHDIRTFHPPAGVFWGLIGGPPCQTFSPLARFGRAMGREPHFGNLIPEFERIVQEARPDWVVMENVVDAPGLPNLEGEYELQTLVLDNRWVGGEQERRRRFIFGSRPGTARRLEVEFVVLMPAVKYATVISGNGFGSGSEYLARQGRTVTAGHDNNARLGRVRYTVEEAARLQGLPTGFLDDSPFTQDGKRRAIANAVPRELGLAIARAVRSAMLGESAAAEVSA